MKKIAKQMSESIELGIVLAASGGFMDAYSYIMRDHVFANAQTGNMLLLGVSISERNWPEVVRYLFPVLAFAAGIMLADLVRFRMDERKRLHWRQISVLLEAIVLAGVCFIIGAVLGNVCISYMQEKAILVCAFFLLAAFIMMFIDREKEEHESRS